VAKVTGLTVLYFFIAITSPVLEVLKGKGNYV